MAAGGCRSLLGWSHGRRQPLCHTCEMGDNYAQGYSFSLLHLGRASPILEELLQTGKPVVCRLCRVFFFCLYLVLVQGRELKWEKNHKTG